MQPSSSSPLDRPEATLRSAQEEVAEGQAGSVAATDKKLSRLSALLDGLQVPGQGSEASDTAASEPTRRENELVQVRLGIASSLFHALHCRHPHTAKHSLRVALCMSTWARARQMSEAERDEIELAALLHDIGKVGVPDSILLKPSQLSAEESLAVAGYRQQSVRILDACCASRGVLNIVRYTPAWFNGQREEFDLRGENLPIGARMLAIVDAFDAMTTDHVYRGAMSRERAVAELFQCAGGQFDRELVEDFCHLLEQKGASFSLQSARKWLQDLAPAISDQHWGRQQVASGAAINQTESLFRDRLLQSMYEGVIFVGREMRILQWNQSVERMTGIPATSICEKNWDASVLDMQTDDGLALESKDCPVAETMASGTQTTRRVTIRGRSKRIDVNIRVVPVVDRDGSNRGAAILLDDVSSQVTLEEKVQSLAAKATQDPLTKVANRAEFDRVHKKMVDEHLEQHQSCSLIICDVDHFKSVNDTYGHQAGDDVLVSFAAMLRRNCRQGDLVGRYGGEEFVMLCADCDNASATEKAEQIRQELSELPHERLHGRSITASFGVTEVQPGDTPETMLHRADRALLRAKESGRNRVVQLGVGNTEGDGSPAEDRGWLNWLFRSSADDAVRGSLLTPVPFKIATEKLKGFVADHDAQVLEIEASQVTLSVAGQREGDRNTPYLLSLELSETTADWLGEKGPKTLRTLIDVTIRPRRSRDRRKSDVQKHAHHLLSSLKSYLMAQLVEVPPDARDAAAAAAKSDR